MLKENTNNPNQLPHDGNWGPVRRRISPILIFPAIAVLLLAVFFMIYRFSSTEYGKMKEDLKRLSEETYDSVLLSMHSTVGFKESDFAYYRGLRTAIMSHAVTGPKELSKYLEQILQSGNSISTIYLCLDPHLLWTDSGEKEQNWNTNLANGLYAYMADNPLITFEILLPYPYIDYWRHMEAAELDTLLTLYHTLVRDISAYSNAKTFFMGAEEWLMINPANYSERPFDANEEISFAIFANTFCGSGIYEITPANESNFWDSLREIIEREQTTPTTYPDLSDWCLVFFGDSILGNYSGSASIPGYVTGLTGASAFNFAIGGTSAGSRGEGQDIPDIFGGFVKENIVLSEEGNLFSPKDTSLEELKGKKICFIFNYGFNDYYSGVPIENPQDPYDITSFKGSLRSCINALQILLPEAQYIIMTPTHTLLMDRGMEPGGPSGDILPAYVSAAQDLASELGLHFLDNYHDFVINDDTLEEYVPDGTHPNEKGRLVIARQLIRFLQEIISD